MLFAEGRSALVRLSDCAKVNLNHCVVVSRSVIDAYQKYASQLNAMKELAVRVSDHVYAMVDGSRPRSRRKFCPCHFVHNETIMCLVLDELE